MHAFYLITYVREYSASSTRNNVVPRLASCLKARSTLPDVSSREKVDKNSSYLFSNHDIVLVVRIICIPKFTWKREKNGFDRLKIDQIVASKTEVAYHLVGTRIPETRGRIFLYVQRSSEGKIQPTYWKETRAVMWAVIPCCQRMQIKLMSSLLHGQHFSSQDHLLPMCPCTSKT